VTRKLSIVLCVFRAASQDGKKQNVKQKITDEKENLLDRF
jgi:hypothetical protein